MIKYFLIVLLFIYSGKITVAQEDNTKTFSLNEAIEYAVDNNLLLENSILNIQKAKKQIWEVTASGLPQINAQVNYQHAIELPVSLVPAEFFGGQAGEFIAVSFGTEDNLTATINASQLIFDGSYFVGIKTATVYKDLINKEFNQTKRDLKVNVSKAYYNALIAKATYDIVKSNTENLREVLKETKAMYENGFVEKLDVNRLELSLSNLQTQLYNTKRQIKLAKALLKFQMNFPLKDSIILTDELDKLAVDDKNIAMIEAQPEQRVEYQLLDIQDRLFQLNINRYKVAHLPSLSAFGQHQQNAQRNDLRFFSDQNEWYPSTIVGLQLSVPIFDGFRKLSLIQQNKLDRQKVINQKELLSYSVKTEVLAAKTAYLNAMAQRENLENNLELANKIYRQTLKKYEEGIGSSLEVSEAESDLYETQGLYLNTLYNLLTAREDLEKALGIIE